MPLTSAQRDAIYDHEDNLIVVAGAGSGKTFVLVERYLALLDRHHDWPLNTLVAITFTQKAAQEMRDRVREHIQRQVDHAETSADAEHWAKRLAEMDSARIDTIHGLCAALLRANAAEAGVDPGFTVLDEIEGNVLVGNALDDVFRSLEAGDPVLALFSEYGEREVRAQLPLLLSLEIHETSVDLFTTWLEEWIKSSQALIDGFQMQIEAVERFAPMGADVLSLGWQVCGIACDWFAHLGERQPLDASLEVIEEVAALTMPGRVANAWGEEGALAKAGLRAIRDCAQATLWAIGEPPGTADQRAARLLPLWFSLADRVRGAYRAAKDERAVLDFDDLETMTRDLLRDDGVRARYLGAEFKHVLVDEFQDTNAAQWAIIRRIADPEQPGCLFVVGDPKQSIYGFRGADVSVFAEVRDRIAAASAPIALDTSFRTHERLVACLNFLFAAILVRDPASAARAYEVEFGGGMLADRLDAPSDAPALELLLLDQEKLKAAETEEAINGREWEARAIARRLKSIVEVEQRVIFDKERQMTRPIEYGDAALLFQAMTHVTLYEAALKAEGIPYLTVAGKGYYDRQEVWDLLNLLRALYNPADNLALAAALRSPLFSLSDDALLALRLTRDGEGKPTRLWDALDQPDYVPADEVAQVEFARATLADLRRQAGRVTIAELLRSALEQTGYLAVLTGLPDGKRQRGNVEKLLEKAETSGRITLSAFTQYLEDMSESEAREGDAALESAGAVQLMTVHKSKGLEFPLVVLVDASYLNQTNGGGLVNGLACKVYDPTENKLISTFAYRRAEAFDRLRETAERRRLFYVAATRAQDYLLISGQVSCKAGKPIAARAWLKWLIDALDLREIPSLDTQLSAYEWGEARIDFPPPMAESDADDEPISDWDAVPVGADAPFMLRAVPQATDAPVRSLTATQLADLGSARDASTGEDRAFYAERWRRSVYHGAPATLDQVQRGAPKKVGEIVHRALRWTLPEDDDALRDLLRHYAWEEGIVEDTKNENAVEEAFTLLERVRRSDVFAEIGRAREVYRELPFVYATAQRTVHGVIDLLIHGADGHWRLVDFKTGWLGASVRQAELEAHARRFDLQLGVYAAAVEALVGVAPIAYIHYIRYAYTVLIEQDDWRQALARLEETIGDVIGHG